MDFRLGRRAVAAVLVCIVVLGTVPGVAAAETRAGGTVVVEEGTSVDGLQAFGGSVVVRGTVNGDLQAFGGSVVIAESGAVTGDVQVAAGSLSIAGTVGGNVEAATGSVDIESTAVIGGDLRAGAETVTIAGTVQGTVEAGSETLRLTDTAVVNGDVRHGEDTTYSAAEGATVTGAVVAVDDLNVDVGIGPIPIPNVAGWLVTIYGAIFLLIVGAVLLAAFPRFTDGVADRVADSPVRTAGTGLLGVLGVLAGVVVLFITILGIPLALIALLLFVLAVIAAVALGQYAIGAWTLSLAEVDNRWAALVVGVVGVTLVSQVPYVGWVFDVAAFALGFGALLLGVWTVWQERGDDGEADQSEADTGTATN